MITVTYNTEHVVEYTRLTARRALVRSVATSIAELADVGTCTGTGESGRGRQRLSLESERLLALRGGRRAE